MWAFFSVIVAIDIVYGNSTGYVDGLIATRSTCISYKGVSVQRHLKF